ncbi:MAG: oligosaccharide flippase family protein [Bacteroidales bacterium]|nr:oligosaccharide flippase family protein [Bacteroidales bacterium]
MSTQPQKTLLNEIATLLSGKAVAQIVALLAYLALTRLYSPDDFGLFNLFYSPIELLIIISTCKLELSIIAAHTDPQAHDLARLALRINTAVSLVLLAAVGGMVVCNALPGQFSALGLVALIIPPFVFFCGTSRVYAALFNRQRQYRPMAWSETINSVTAAVAKIGLALVPLSRSGMPLGALAGQMASNLNLIHRLRRTTNFFGTRSSRAQLKAAARSARNYPLFVATKDIVSTLSANLPFLAAALPLATTATTLTTTQLGLLGLALTLTARPLNLFAGACERVLFARTAQLQRSGQPIGKLVWRYLTVSYAIASVLCIVAYFVAEPACVLCFGDRWSGSGAYIRILLPWVVLRVGSLPLTFVANLFSTQRTELLFYIAQLALSTAAIAIGLWQGSLLLGMRLFAMCGCIIAVAITLWYMMQVHRYDHQIHS